MSGLVSFFVVFLFGFVWFGFYCFFVVFDDFLGLFALFGLVLAFWGVFICFAFVFSLVGFLGFEFVCWLDLLWKGKKGVEMFVGLAWCLLFWKMRGISMCVPWCWFWFVCVAYGGFV